MFRSLWFALGLLLANVSLGAEPAAQLLLPSRTLEPKSTFELRFAAEMVPAEQVGRPAEPSPLVFDPPIDGRFVWLSTRSGSFEPAGILPLGTKYKIGLRPGLKDVRGKPVAAQLRETAETPPMRVKGSVATTYVDEENATAVPRYTVLFNANVKAADAAKFVRFVNAAAQRVEARVEQVEDPKQRDRGFNKWNSDDKSLAVWGETLQEDPLPSEGEEDAVAETDVPGKSKLTRQNLLHIFPAKPLPPGKDWRLVLDAGLPAAEGRAKLGALHEIRIGEVQPFAADEIVAETNRVEGRRVNIGFTKNVGDEVTPETFSQWIKVEPAVPNLKANIGGDIITLRGGFALGTRYRVTVAAGLPARDPVATLAATTTEIAFDKVAPRLYFQDFATHQQAAGTRQLRLVAMNVPRVRVSAKLFKGDEILAATKAYEDYMKEPGDSPGDEFYSKVPLESVPGTVIWEKELTNPAAVDKDETMALSWDEIIGPNRSGAVLVTAESIDPVSPPKRVGTQTLVQVTDIGATWKRDVNGTRLHLFSLATGKSIASARLRLFNTETEQLAEATTDERGDAQLPKAEDPRWVLAEREGDTHLIALNEGDIPLYQLGVTTESPDDQSSARSVFLFTERGVYKPGEVVHLKGYAQDPNPDRPRIPTGKDMTVKVTDSKDRQISLTNVTLSEFGSFDQDITVPDGSLGRFTVEVNGAEGDRLGGLCFFQVQEYKPNAFEVLIPAPPQTTGSTQLDLPITSKYLMGKPLSKARLTWSLVARDEQFKPDGLAAFAFNNNICDYRLNRALDRLSRFDAQGEMAVDANGVARVTTPLPVNPKAPQPRATKLLAEVTDINQQTVSESRSFVQHSSEFYFGLRRFDTVMAEGKPLPIEVIAVNTDGKPLDAPVTAKVRLTHINWQTNRLAAAGDTTDFESKPIPQLVWERELQTAPGIGDDRKPAVAKLGEAVAGTPGEYLLEIAGKDARGHDVLTSMVFEVSGEVEADWNYRNPYIIDLVADKDSYEPGQTATILVKTPIAGDALVSVERDRVLRSFVVPLTGNAPSVQVPIEAGDGPNVFVSVMMLRGSNDSPRQVKAPEYRIGYAELKVARPKQKLTVEVRGPRATRPKEKVSVEAEVRDHAGKAAADAEVTLYAVDEGILSLTGYATPDPISYFNQPRGLGVTTALTLPTMLKEDAAESDFANKGYLIGDGKGGPALLNGLRKDFLPCAFWHATLRTNADGKVSAEFPAPDSLTRYRVIAVAVTKQSQFGAGESAFEINKPVMIESALPAFANVGDKLTMRAVVHNTTDFGGRAEVWLKLDDTARAGETHRQIALPARGTISIDFPVDVVKTGSGKWSWAVKFVATDGTAEIWDEVEAKITVRHPAPAIRQVTTSRIEADTAELLRITDPQIIEGTGEITVNLTNTRVVELRESLRRLLEYPYGCAEQTTSSLLPWLSVRDLQQTLPEIARPDEEIEKAVNTGIRLLMSMQTSGGGLSYWPGGREPMLWGSAYAAIALTLAQQQGFAVPEGDYNRLLKYLSDNLRGTAQELTGYGLNDRCMAVYALAVAGKPEPAYHDVLYQKRAKMTAEDRALLALAIIQSKGPKQMIDELLRAPLAGENYVEQWFGSAARENALHLLAWTLHQPRAPRVDQLATELFTRRSNGHWGTTQGNAWSLLALASYLRAVESGPKDVSGAISWGTASTPFRLGAGKPLASALFWFKPDSMRDPVMVKKQGGQVFSEVAVAARSKLIEHPRQDQGYGLSRRYAKIGDDGKLSPATNLRVGDRVLVTLDVDVRRRATYIALEDPLPGVLAPINPAFKSQEVAAGETLGNQWVSDYSELRQDRAVFFVDVLYPGRYTLRYLTRVICAGEATAPSAKIEEMYHPERFGTTETLKVSAQPLE
jgi:alpha-2-macroglobulin